MPFSVLRAGVVKNVVAKTVDAKKVQTPTPLLSSSYTYFDNEISMGDRSYERKLGGISTHTVGVITDRLDGEDVQTGFQRTLRLTPHFVSNEVPLHQADDVLSALKSALNDVDGPIAVDEYKTPKTVSYGLTLLTPGQDLDACMTALKDGWAFNPEASANNLIYLQTRIDDEVPFDKTNALLDRTLNRLFPSRGKQALKARLAMAEVK